MHVVSLQANRERPGRGLCACARGSEGVHVESWEGPSEQTKSWQEPCVAKGHWTPRAYTKHTKLTKTGPTLQNAPIQV